MISNNTNKLKKTSGFTIVELLIVIVVIGILAAITIVAYNGIQKKANTTSAQNAANSVMKKIEASNAVKSGYPASTITTAANYIAALDADETSKITGSGNTIAATVNSGNGKTTVRIANCSTGGAEVYYFDYATGALVSKADSYKAGDTSGTCTALAS